MKAIWKDIQLVQNAGALRQIWACWQCGGGMRCEILLPLNAGTPDHCLKRSLDEKIADN